MRLHRLLVLSLLASTAFEAGSSAVAQTLRGNVRMLSEQQSPYVQRRRAIQLQKNQVLTEEKTTNNPVPTAHTTHFAQAPLRVNVPSIPVSHRATTVAQDLPVRALEIQLDPERPTPGKHMQASASQVSPLLPIVASSEPAPITLANETPLPATPAIAQKPLIDAEIPAEILVQKAEPERSIFDKAPEPTQEPKKTIFSRTESEITAPKESIFDKQIAQSTPPKAAYTPLPWHQDNNIDSTPEIEASSSTANISEVASAPEQIPSTNQPVADNTQTLADAADSMALTPSTANSAPQISPNLPTPIASANTPTTSKKETVEIINPLADAEPSTFSPGSTIVASNTVEASEPLSTKINPVDAYAYNPKDDRLCSEDTISASLLTPTATLSDNIAPELESPDVVYVIKKGTREEGVTTEVTHAMPETLAGLTPTAGESVAQPTLTAPTPVSPANMASELLQEADKVQAQATPIPVTPLQSTSTAATNTVDPTEPTPTLSPESKKILKKIPSNVADSTVTTKKTKVNISHNHPLEDVLTPASQTTSAEQVETHEAMGIKVDVRKPKMDANAELEKAYNALIAGESSTAVDLYQNILLGEPDNIEALFGLATAYHRAGQLEKARPLYGKILKIDPDNVKALNNFLILVSDEAPDDALTQLQALQQRNPAFSPIPAQISAIYQKKNDYPSATQAMMRAVELSPENMTYRYNLAILLDKQNKKPEAEEIYKQLVQASLQGVPIPNINQVQERLTFLRSNQ